MAAANNKQFHESGGVCHCRQVKAESLIYQQRRASPYELERTSDSKP